MTKRGTADKGTANANADTTANSTVNTASNPAANPAPNPAANAATKRFATGAAWLFGARWLERLIEFASLVILARILSPDDFGLVAIAASVVVIIEGLSALDVSKALIRHRDESRSLYDTAWTLALLRGVFVAGLMLLVAQFVGDARMAGILVVLALMPLLTGLANPRFVMFERALDYSRVAALTLGARLIAFAVTVAIALITRSYWALVIGMIAGTAATTLLGYALRPYRPRFTFSRFRDIFAFSGWLSATGVVTTLAMETDKIIVGRLLGVAEAGYYFMTHRVGVLPTRELVSPLQRILFPSFSELTSEPERLRRVALESINAIATLSLPAAFGFALVAEDFVPLALGAQWAVIVPLIAVLVPYLGLRATLTMALPCVMALGQTRLLFGVSLVYAVVHLPVFIVGTWQFGLPGAIWSIVLAGVWYTVLNAWMLRRCLGLRVGELVARLRRPFLAALTMVVGVWAAQRSLLHAVDMPVLRLLAAVGLGITIYLAALSALWRLEGAPAGIERRLLTLMGR